MLEVRGVRLRVRLGWGDEERARPQALDLALRLELAAPPRACQTDELADTICYAELIERAQRLCEAREFRLLEHLARVLLDELRAALAQGAVLELTVSKPHPPLANVAGGVHFTLRSQA